MNVPDFNEVIRAVLIAISGMPKLRPMASVDPTRRASAGQIILFNGKGLTTAEPDVPPFVEDEEQQGAAWPQVAQAGPAGPPWKPVYSDNMDWQQY